MPGKHDNPRIFNHKSYQHLCPYRHNMYKKTSVRKRLNVLKKIAACSRIGVPENPSIHMSINIQIKVDTKSMLEKVRKMMVEREKMEPNWDPISNTNKKKRSRTIDRTINFFLYFYILYIYIFIFLYN